MDPSEVILLGWVHNKRAASVESTPAGKKMKRSDDSPKPSSKKKSSNKPRSDDLKNLDEKWSERFARLEAMLLSKSFAVPVEPLKKPSAVVTSDQPFFDPGASTSVMSSGLAVEGTGSSLVQTTGEAAALTATQPVEAPGTRSCVAASKSATRPVEGPCTGVLATEPVEAPGAGAATQPVEAPGAGPEVLLTGTDSDVQLDQSLTAGKSADITGGSERGRSVEVNWAPLLMATYRASSQMIQLTRTSLKKLVTERLSEGSDLSWAGTRSLTLTVFHLP